MAEDQKLVFERSPNAEWRVIDGEAVLTRPDDGKVCGLNATGATIWEKLGPSESVEALVEKFVVPAFQVEVGQATKDAVGLLLELESKGWVKRCL